jgi:ribonuclease P protein component
MRATFPPAARLHRPSEFAAALKGRHVAKGALFVVSTPRGTPDPASQPRLGLIVAKRMAPLAVSRNAIKRVIRETFRQRRHELPPRDFVFRLHSRIGAWSLRELKARVRGDVEALLERSRR